MNFLKLIVLIILNVSMIHLELYAQFGTNIKKAEFNGGHNDYNATNYKDGVIFCSNRKNQILISYIDHQTSEPLSKFYFSKKNNSNFSKPIVLDQIFSGNYQYGAFCFTDNDSTIYFTRSDKNDTSKTYLSIYISKKIPSGWSTPKPFVYNSPVYNVGHPCISADGNKMYFVSDMAGGLGEKDIYFCEKIDGEWEIPVNLGSKINSPKSELFPFINQSGILYFASDRAGGMGKLDIYSTSRSGDRYAQPEPLPSPINSKDDDFTYFSDATEISGFISSNRSGRDKIYQFSDSRPQFKNCDTILSFDPCYVFFDETEVNINKLPLVYSWDMGDGTIIKQKEASYCFKKPGTFNVKLEILDTLTNSIFFTGSSFEMVIEEPKQANIDIADTIPINREVLMNAKKSNIDTFEPYKYYWDVAKLPSKEGLEISQIFPYEGNYKIILGVLGKPDKNGVSMKSCVFKDIFAADDSTFKKYQLKNELKLYNDSVIAQARQGDNIMAALHDSSAVSKNTSILNYQTTDEKINQFFDSDEVYNTAEEIRVTLSALNMDTKGKVEILNSLNIATVFNDKEMQTVYKIEIASSKEKIGLNSKLFEPLQSSQIVSENYMPNDGVYSYAVGEEKELSNLYPLYKEIKKLNFFEATVKEYVEEKIIAFDEINKLKKEPIVNSIFRTDFVYFKTMQYEIEPEFFQILEEINSLMKKFPEMIIEISAHTDNSGTREYNLLLSEKRAQTTYEYLLKKGVDASRLKATGYAFDKPIAPNTTEEGRQKNRRVEFKVIENK